MALRDSKLFRAFCYSIVGLAILSFVVRVFITLSASGDSEYRGGRGLPIQYSSAAVMIVVVAVALAFCGVVWLVNRWRDKRGSGGDV